MVLLWAQIGCCHIRQPLGAVRKLGLRDGVHRTTADLAVRRVSAQELRPSRECSGRVHARCEQLADFGRAVPADAKRFILAHEGLALSP